MALPLDRYSCEAIGGMIHDGRPTETLREKLSLKLETHHAIVFQYLLWVEEAQMNIDIHHYDLKDAVMTKVPGGCLALRVSF